MVRPTFRDSRIGFGRMPASGPRDALHLNSSVALLLHGAAKSVHALSAPPDWRASRVTPPSNVWFSARGSVIAAGCASVPWCWLSDCNSRTSATERRCGKVVRGRVPDVGFEWAATQPPSALRRRSGVAERRCLRAWAGQTDSPAPHCSLRRATKQAVRSFRPLPPAFACPACARGR